MNLECSAATEKLIVVYYAVAIKKLKKIFSFIYDLKYGSGIRKGENLSKNELQKYKNAAATIYK